MNIEAKLGLDVFSVDGEQPHIVIDHEACRARCTIRYCLLVCPAKAVERIGKHVVGQPSLQEQESILGGQDAKLARV